ncbi:hypothetical protein SDRG_02256 [Saprolegnia diclina VS20]|uniref:Uncharacterized protein n=1 Tax=Saprolegnia diclina (strain VS20) TaxID=1156394 RepID=T0R1Z0_SAPDV|nr:hypothetical protein SDRG_02256 [Saprolegnia diclina VS20]EQC40355.1 hypothetical protein SDRG_02256 [Saprolegnia diclina VS20]|eukprot:XP_008606054.1 hypothetical protein SDRG_02256 [Saprolegnia diclina VS20]
MQWLLPSLLAVAATTSAQLLLDSGRPDDNLPWGSPVSKDQAIAVQFRSARACGVNQLVDYANVTVTTKNIDPKATWITLDICPTVNGLPACDANAKADKFKIETVSKRIEFQWVPSTPKTLQPDAHYWLVMTSNVEEMGQAVIWYDGRTRFGPTNDPRNDVLSAFTLSSAMDWVVDEAKDGRTVASAQIAARPAA